MRKAANKEREPQLTLRQHMALAMILIVNAPPPPLKAPPASWKR